ncbi:hypothetical protein CesoFtcFv8_013753 [Champsocephalus esox]|uniref:Uncharacterized protein n=1 Tax=Champsocephalus esox TaxID=159716 RepID=A0AAN8BRC3_9TELE|nr:hypothetical protein CesoFtcFv8_013753 [Champsocephalus esox]
MFSSIASLNVHYRLQRPYSTAPTLSSCTPPFFLLLADEVALLEVALWGAGGDACACAPTANTDASCEDHHPSAGTAAPSAGTAAPGDANFKFARSYPRQRPCGD